MSSLRRVVFENISISSSEEVAADPLRRLFARAAKPEGELGPWFLTGSFSNITFHATNKTQWLVLVSQRSSPFLGRLQCTKLVMRERGLRDIIRRHIFIPDIP